MYETDSYYGVLLNFNDVKEKALKIWKRMKISHYNFSTIGGIVSGLLYFITLSRQVGDLLAYFYIFFVPPLLFIGFSYLLPRIHPIAWKEIKTHTNCMFLFLAGNILAFTIPWVLGKISSRVFLIPLAFLYDFVIKPLISSFSLHIYAGVYTLTLPPTIIAAYIGTRNTESRRILIACLLILVMTYIQYIGWAIFGF